MKEQILKLHSEGKSYNEIVVALGCSKGTVSYYCGSNQKNKALIRNQKNRKSNAIATKLGNYKGKKSLKDRALGFQRRENGKCVPREDFNFNYTDVLNKFGEKTKCYLTGREVNLLDASTYEFDHIIPAFSGGANTLDNLGIACKDANRAKSNLTLMQFLSLCKEVLENNGFRVELK